MSTHDHGDCGYNNTWDYESRKPRHRRRHSRKRHDDCWSYRGW